jgi:hypothetical protein
LAPSPPGRRAPGPGTCRRGPSLLQTVPRRQRAAGRSVDR